MAMEKSTRLMVIIGISFSFFVAEISVGFYTHSLALVADAFHYMNDLVGFIVALVAIQISKRENSPKELSFGWQRAQLLGAFFNGVFLLALGVSIFLQSIERFIRLQKVENPMLVLIMGCVGLTLNIISALFLHEHDHGPKAPLAAIHTNTSTIELTEASPHPHKDHRHISSTVSPSHGHDLGMMGVMIHVIGDAINNIGVIIAAAVIWKASYEGRYYADPGVSMGIAFMILLTSLPLVKSTSHILLESLPSGISIEDIKHDLLSIPGVVSIHELHAWRLSQHKSLASAHVLTSDDSLSNFMVQAKMINECLHAYGIHSSTLQPELCTPEGSPVLEGVRGGERGSGGNGEVAVSSAVAKEIETLKMKGKRAGAVDGVRRGEKGCRVVCGMDCGELMCCG